jgi:xylulokinase
MAYVLGFDSSTQSLTGLLIHLEDLRIVSELAVSFGEFPEFRCPRGFLENLPTGEVHADPRVWLAALEKLLERMKNERWPLGEVVALSGSGQQHGSVYLKSGFAEKLSQLDPGQSLVSQLEGIFSRPTSPIWMDVSTSAECAEITAAAGGAQGVCERSGSLAIERFTGPQIRAFWKRDPQAYGETSRIHLVSSFLCSVLSCTDAPIDTGDGAGMNLMNLAKREWDSVLLGATAPQLESRLPAVQPATSVAGPIGSYFVERFGFAPACVVLLFTGDNPSSLVGMGAAGGTRLIVSLGTSDVLFAAMKEPKTDPDGCGHVFGNPLGGYMTLAVVRNGSLAREAFRDQLGADWSDFEKAGETNLPDDAVSLPFMTAEITPKRSGGLIESRPDLPVVGRIRAFLEGQAFNLLRQLEWMDLHPNELCLTGGASRNHGIAQIFADVFQVPVSRLAIPNSAALGAAMRAALAMGADQSQLEHALTGAGSTVQPSSHSPVTNARYERWRMLLEKSV